MTKKRCVGYCRISTDKQETLETQEECLRKYADDNGLEFLYCYYDVGSGEETLTLEGFKKLIAKITESKGERNIDELLVTRIDRLSRNPMQFEEMTDFANINKILIRAINKPLASYKELHEEVIKAQQENQNKRKKTRIAIQNAYNYKKKPVFGYKNTQTGIVIDKEKAEIVRLVFDMYAKGNSYRQINEILKLKLNISRMLKDIRYIGFGKFCDSIEDIKYPPIVSQELFASVNRMVKDKNADRNTKEELIKNADFEGLLYCRECNQKLILDVPKGKSRNDGRFLCPSDAAHITKRKSNVLRLFLKYAKKERLSKEVFMELSKDIIIRAKINESDLSDKTDTISWNTRLINQYSPDKIDPVELEKIKLIDKIFKEILILKEELLLHYLAGINDYSKRLNLFKASYPEGFLYDGKQIIPKGDCRLSTADLSDEDRCEWMKKFPEGTGKDFFKMLASKFVAEKFISRELGCFKQDKE
ncbi:MAG TPA: recombinase family protein [Candidatus Cloacimonadota bacterium]|nr:recombinase family protein [Candidatus Cloacimonadota bacterium]